MDHPFGGLRVFRVYVHPAVLCHVMYSDIRIINGETGPGYMLNGHLLDIEPC